MHRLSVLALLLAMIADVLATWHGLSLGTAQEMSPLVHAYGWGLPLALKGLVVLVYVAVLEMVPSLAVMRSAVVAATFTTAVAAWDLAQ